MAIVQTGTTQFTGTGGTNNATGTFYDYIDVPADAEFAVVGVVGIIGDASGFTSVTMPKGSVDTAMTKAATGADADGSKWQAALFTMVAPDTGDDKLLGWSWTSNSEENPKIAVTFWKGVDTSSPVRDADGIQQGGYPMTTPTLTASSGDLILAVFGGYTGGSNGNVSAWSNLSSLGEMTTGDPTDIAFASGSPSGNTTVGVTSVSGGYTSFTALAAIVLKPASSGYTVTAEAGSYAFTGTNATFDYSMTADAGSYAFTGTDATPTKINAYTVTATPGSYAFTGSTATLTHGGIVSAASAAFDSTDSDSTLLGDNGIYTFTHTVAAATGQERLVILAGIGAPEFAIDYDACTIDGVTATRVGTVARGHYDGGAQTFLTAYRAAGTANTSINVAATSNAPGGGMYGGVSAVFKLSNAATLYAQTNSAVSDPVLSVNTVAGGATVAMVAGYADSSDMLMEWSGITERFDTVYFGNSIFSGASADTASASTPLTITTSMSHPLEDSNDSVAGIALSFSPLTATPGVYTITATAGSYAFTGTDAATTKAGAAAYTVTATAGSYAFTGTDATFVEGATYSVTAEAGSYSFTGTDATLTKTVGPPVYRAKSTIALATSTNTVVAKPSNTADGDILIAAIYVRNPGAAVVVTPPAGWTQIGTTSATNTGGSFANFYVWWKRASGEPISWTFTHASAQSAYVALAYLNCVATGSPIDVFSQQSANTGTTAIAPSVTTTTANDRLIFLSHNWSTASSLSPPGGMTERQDGLIYAADIQWLTPAATGQVAQFSVTSPYTAFQIALKPQAAAASVPATLTYESVDNDTNTLGDNGTYTFPMTSSATTAEERLILLGGSGGPLFVADFDSVTVDGVVATRVGIVARGASDGSGSQAFLTAYRAAGTANTSFNVIATANCPGGGMYYGVCSCFRLTNATTLYAQTSTATDDPVLSVNTIGSGTTLAAVFGFSGPDPNPVTWSGLTERIDQVFSGSLVFSAASADISSGSAPLAVTADISAPMVDSNDSVAGIALSFNPVSASTAYSVTALPGSYAFTGTIAGTTLSAVEGIAQTGTVITTTSAGSTANTGTFYDFITVPADAELALVGVTGHTGVANGFATITMPKGGIDVPMTRLTGGDVSTSVWQAAMFYMVSPDTGIEKLLTWDWAGSATTSTSTELSVTFWKGVDLISPIRDSDGAQGNSFPITTPTLTAQTGDRLLTFFGGFVGGAEGSVDSWTNASTLANPARNDYLDLAWGSGNPTGNTTVSVASVTGFSEGGLCAAVLKPADRVASVVYETSGITTTMLGDDGTYTFLPVGAALAAGQERLLLLGGIGSPLTTWDFDSVIIDGNPATRVGTVSRGPDGGGASAMMTAYRAAGTANTAFSIVVTAHCPGGGVYTGAYALFRLNDAGALTDQTSAATNDPVLSVDTLANGVTVAGVFGYAGPDETTATWTGLTENAEIVGSGDVFTVASASTTTAETPRTISVGLEPNLDEVTTDSVASLSLSFEATTGSTVVTHTITVTAGAYLFTGTDATAFGEGVYTIDAEAGAYNFEGTLVTIGYGVDLEPGSYSFTGSPVTLSYSLTPTGPVFVNATGSEMTVSAGTVSITARIGIAVNVTGSTMVMVSGRVGVNGPPTAGAGEAGGSTGLLIDVGKLMGG